MTIDHSTAQPPIPRPMPMHRWLERHHAPRPRGLFARLFAASTEAPAPATAAVDALANTRASK